MLHAGGDPRGQGICDFPEMCFRPQHARTEPNRAIGRTPQAVWGVSATPNTTTSPSANNTLTMITETKRTERKGWRCSRYRALVWLEGATPLATLLPGLTGVSVYGVVAMK